jgi:two-component system OmpR family sensor kinase
MTIRARLTAAISLLLLLIVALLGAIIVRASRDTLIQQVDARVMAAAVRMEPGRIPGRGDERDDGRGGDRSSDEGDDDDDGDEPRAVRTVVPLPAAQPAVGADGEEIERPVARIRIAPHGRVVDVQPSGYPDDPDPLPQLPATPGDLAAMAGRIVTIPATSGDLAYRASAQISPDGWSVITAAPLSSVDEALERIRRIVAIAAVSALALAALGVWFITGRGLQPADRMIETASAIAAGDLTRRVPDADPHTELGRLGAALNEMLARIEEAADIRAASEARLRRFVADAAHELRTPLTSLRGYAELYRQGALPDEAAVGKAMTRIESESVRMGRLVDDLLLLARMDQQPTLDRQPIHLAAIVRDAADAFRAADPARPLDLSIEDDPVVSGDPLRLRQVVDNLLANARIHTPAGTPVHLTLARATDAPEVIITVADEGPGIPPEDRERVFERFWRSDAGRTRAKGGTGLGLAIVASLVAAHGGTVTAGTAPGRGAVFTVRLPLASKG